MKRPIAIGLSLFFALAVGFLIATLRAKCERVTVVSLSPDDKLRIHLVELNNWGDRDFVLRLERIADESFETIFKSPDEGFPIGSERIVWSPDSQKFVLLGRHFYVREGTPSTNGELLYLLYDRKTCKMWCNASQQAAYPHFEARDVEWIGTPTSSSQP